MRTRRSGFSLIEVMIAMSICLLGLTVLLQMTSLAQRYAQRSAELVEEQIICQNILNEICSGMRSWHPVTSEVSEHNPNYEFSVRFELPDPLGLRLVEVMVRRADSAGRVAPESSPRRDDTSSTERTAHEFRMARLVRAEPRDPSTPQGTPVDRGEGQVPK